MVKQREGEEKLSEAANKKWPVVLAPDPTDPSRTLVCPLDPTDTRAHFSNALVAAQRLVPVASHPAGGKTVFTRSAFRHPDRAALAAAAEAAASPTFYSARLLAFAATVAALRPALVAAAAAAADASDDAPPPRAGGLTPP